MLFNELSYFNYQFPTPQYLGAKHTHLSWLSRFIPKKVNTALDAFAGSQSVAFLFKQLGFKTLTNDFLKFNHQIGLALIENNSIRLTKDDTALLFSPAVNKENYQLIDTLFTNIFFEQSEALFLDNFKANIALLDNPYKQALAYSIINRSMTRKITMGHFAHTQALNYANNAARIKRNSSLARPLKELFTELLADYNYAVFDNSQDNYSYQQNIVDLLPTLEKIDLVYFDPPYCDSHADYQSFYHVLETFTEYWQDKQFINSIKRYEPQRFSGFDKKRDVLNSLNQLFELADVIPHWLISYNNRSYPDIEQFKNILSRYRNVQIETKTYMNSRGGKGSVAGSQEILFICQPKKQHYFSQEKTA